MPTIRTHNLEHFVDHMQRSCTKCDLEFVFVSPFDLPENLQNRKDISLVKDFGSVTRAIQLGALHATGDYMLLAVDDCTFLPGTIDRSLDVFTSLDTTKDAVSIRYSEGGGCFDHDYWKAGYHNALNKCKGIDPNWTLGMLFLVSLNRFDELGGFDCIFEYANGAIHDFIFRLQKDGGKVALSPEFCCTVTHYPGESADHAPIHHAQLSHDDQIFNQMYAEPNDRIKIDFENWRNSPSKWERRFGNDEPKSYDELAKLKGYRV